MVAVMPQTQKIIVADVFILATIGLRQWAHGF
jgi:hypothetical protein